MLFVLLWHANYILFFADDISYYIDDVPVSGNKCYTSQDDGALFLRASAIYTHIYGMIEK